jgi:hypothetical protein
MNNSLLKIGLMTLTMMMGLAGSAKADFLTGNDLRLYCASKNPSDDAICIVYITGAFDAFTTGDLIAQKTSASEAQFCPPEDVNPEQLKATMVAYLEREETNLDFAATLLVLGAMTDIYGCKP